MDIEYDYTLWCFFMGYYILTLWDYILMIVFIRRAFWLFFSVLILNFYECFSWLSLSETFLRRVEFPEWDVIVGIKIEISGT